MWFRRPHGSVEPLTCTGFYRALWSFKQCRNLLSSSNYYASHVSLYQKLSRISHTNLKSWEEEPEDRFLKSVWFTALCCKPNQTNYLLHIRCIHQLSVWSKKSVWDSEYLVCSTPSNVNEYTGINYDKLVDAGNHSGFCQIFMVGIGKILCIHTCGVGIGKILCIHTCGVGIGKILCIHTYRLYSFVVMT